MGMLLSVPVNIATTIATNLACCCAQSSCACLSTFTSSSSTAARLAWVLLFLLAAALAFCLSTPFVYTRILDALPSLFSAALPGCKECFGAFSVHAVCFALAMVMALFAATAVAVTPANASSARGRLAVHRGFWGVKTLLLLGAVVLVFTALPASAVAAFATYVAPAMAALFLLLQLLVVVDGAHGTAERLLGWYDDDSFSSGASAATMILTTLLAYAAAITCSVLLLIPSPLPQSPLPPSPLPPPSGTTTTLDTSNSPATGTQATATAVGSVNIVLMVVVSLLSIMPFVREHNFRSGLVQSSLVSFYASALVFSSSGVGIPLPAGVATTSLAMTGVFLLAALVHIVFGRVDNALVLRTDGEGGGLGLGSSSSADIADAAADGPGGEGSDRDAANFENTSLDYRPMLFLFVLMCASGYLGMYLTGWHSFPELGDKSVTEVPKTTSATSAWIHISASWLAYALYTWTLLAPVVLPDRDWS